ncbi:hypothetical protein AOQ84DRAFT_50784 [Glonium stellatum]|uniref:Uncharacterized protein n=1 Tax=Glonium stellatum TaxID=574774 RepID=A0A8E2JSE4_9PEZI|nr:hypothetical protein AOQ84DRAFT_50784 [Glonium stellatum]
MELSLLLNSEPSAKSDFTARMPCLARPVSQAPGGIPNSVDNAASPYSINDRMTESDLDWIFKGIVFCPSLKAGQDSQVKLRCPECKRTGMSEATYGTKHDWGRHLIDYHYTNSLWTVLLLIFNIRKKPY